MKRCSTCNRTFTDPNLRFCIDDGTPLTEVAPDDDATVVTPRDNDANDWNAVAYQPPGSYVPPGTEVKRRRLWPWIVGIAGAFILGIFVLGIAAAVLVPRLTRRAERVNTGRNINQRENVNPPATSNTNDELNVDVNAPPPTDRGQVLAQLTQIENEWTVANLNADKKKLDLILADDFVGQSNQGESQTKAEYIRTIQKDSSVEGWEFSDMNLTLAGDRATLTGTITYRVRAGTVAFDFTDRFVWREGRWQATRADLKEKDSTNFDF